MSFQIIFPQLSWCEFLHILIFLEYTDKFRCGCVNKSAYVHIALREKTLRQATITFPSHFLPCGYRQERVLLMSYPRSGNSYLRQLLEQATGIVTGSDSRSNRPLAASLIRCGFKGEGVIDSSVWIVKSHYPERMGYVKCRGQRVILLVRNPFDAIESYFHMGLTNTHDKALADEVFDRYPDLWTQCVRNEAQLWADFHHYWLSDGNIDHFNAKASDSRAPTYSEDEDNSDSSSSSSSSGDSSRNIHTQSHTVSARVPTLVVRYEDLLSDPAATMHTISSYLDSGRPPSPQCYLKKPSAQGVLKLPIMSKSNSTSTPTSTSSSNGSSNGTNSDIINPGYRPKGGGIGKSLRRMDARLIKDVLNTPRMKQYLKLFGYDISEPDSKSSVSIVTDSSSSILNKMSEESRTHTYQINIKPSEVCLIDTPTENKSLSESILINDAFSIRSPDDPFGRNFTFTRREITDNDTSPLPTVSRLP